MGVRVSTAEAQDAWRAVEHLGVIDRNAFRLALRATLVKDSHDFATFEELFPVYFGVDAPPLLNPQAELSPKEQSMLSEAMESFAADLTQLLNWLLNGNQPTQDELGDLADQAGMDSANAPYQARWYARRMQRILGWDQLEQVLEMLWDALAQMGMDPQSIARLKEQVSQNQQNLSQQLEDFAGQEIRDNMVDQWRGRRDRAQDLMDRSFGSLSEHEMDVLRDEVRRLTARLRSRASLRQKRGKQGRLDAKATIRANQRYGGVPLEIKHRTRRKKPRLVIFLDVSTSMRPVAEFFLRLLYELQDQVQKTRSYAFIDHLEDVTPDLKTLGMEEAIRAVLTKLPPGYYSTNLGSALREFGRDHMADIDHRTTVIFLGDARNNFNDPAVEVLEDIARRSRRVIWMTPEYRAQWGTGDSDMLQYEPLCSVVYNVRNLKQLTDAIDNMLSE